MMTHLKKVVCSWRHTVQSVQCHVIAASLAPLAKNIAEYFKNNFGDIVFFSFQTNNDLILLSIFIQ